MATDYNRLLTLEKELYRRDAISSFPVFLNYTDEQYSRQWFHTLIARKCQQLLEGTLGKSRVMFFIPPQHGKSEITSRKFPAYALGKYPRLKVAGASYSADLAEKFSLAVQRTMQSDEYARLFPDTKLPSSGDKTWKSTNEYFEVVGHGGSYKAVGVGGALTGSPVDLGIIDDPIKDAEQAESKRYRDRVWEWYVSVFLTRLHNDSKQILIQTRWHDDDLAGRLLKQEPEKWEIVSIPAIREDMRDPNDPREVGDALWESKHSIAKIRDLEALSPRTFAALYQQRPVIAGGNIVKREWFKRVTRDEFDRMHRNEPIIFFLDTAYTSKTSNDPTGIISTCKIGNELYVVHGDKVLLEFPELIRFIKRYVAENGYKNGSSIRIEPKANGMSIIQQLQRETSLNVTKTKTPHDDKETRLNVASPSIECGRVVLVDGAWNEPFLDEVCGFPSQPHDEYVDILSYAIDYHLISPFKPIDTKRLSAIVH